ncbi:MAG: lytic transglycosylase domain-containing protein [Oceanibaculum nanhaiense]|uniref:lytic transglycosylase domain-containing protein n=1 Tax=Oceanibaculum nanhaiense TaxID=1909734 RepID=UPI0025A4B3A3|nr:lytic transglycosylase domain-containing protein [Oceanibaculum nanhaiense]MDM7945846.1 lytic transglycosylase domain-containing protein [Oceanibaculum nanhaiense]
MLAALLAVGLSMPAKALDGLPIETALLSPGTLEKALEGQASGLPAVLRPSDAQLYKRIFSLQTLGRWEAADREIAKLNDRSLMGHVLYQRYMHPTAYRSSYEELRRWLELYADHPEASRVHGLALKRKPAGAKAPPAPVQGFLYGNGTEGSGMPERISIRNRAGKLVKNAAADQVLRQITALSRDGSPSAALKLLEERLTGEIDALPLALARGEIAAGYYLANRDDLALENAAKAVRQSADRDMMAAWVAGLAAWRLGKFNDSGRYFEMVALDDDVSGWTAAAAAYWASRVHLKQRRPAEATRWLARAATFPASFYGLLARRALGVETPANWGEPPLDTSDFRYLMAQPGGKRSLALNQLDMTELAEMELRKLYPRIEPERATAVLAVANRANMAGLALRLASRLQVATGERYKVGLFPMPQWEPPGGFIVDKALLFSIIRQESAFDVRAQSGSGARGLMQLMPSTARLMATDEEYAGNRSDLFDPDLNLTLGQRYLQHLIGLDTLDGNLFWVVASYNAGPGNLRRWLKQVDYRDDPLLFIESIPSRETRNFVERVVANFWTYRMRMGQPSPSLVQVAAGQWPMYESLDPQAPGQAPGQAPASGSIAQTISATH